MIPEKLLCANCKTFVLKNNIKVIKGFRICPCCLENNHINYEALEQDLVVFSNKMNEEIIKKEQEKIAEIEVFY